MKRTFQVIVALWFGLMVIGCGGRDAAPKQAANGTGALAKGKYLLTSEPAGAKGVFATREAAAALKNGDEIAVVGRIGGSTKPFTGRASFTIVDASLKPCSELEGDNCPTPWDYCCEPPDNLAKATLLVKIVDENGRTLGDDAEQALGLKALQTVVVRGAVQRDEKGQITSLAATGVYVR